MRFGYLARHSRFGFRENKRAFVSRKTWYCWWNEKRREEKKLRVRECIFLVCFRRIKKTNTKTKEQKNKRTSFHFPFTFRCVIQIEKNRNSWIKQCDEDEHRGGEEKEAVVAAVAARGGGGHSSDNVSGNGGQSGNLGGGAVVASRESNDDLSRAVSTDEVSVEEKGVTIFWMSLMSFCRTCCSLPYFSVVLHSFRSHWRSNDS